jgi:hypothetical protein
MNTEPIKLDPDLGVWTPAFVHYCLVEKTDEEFLEIYGKTKDQVRFIADIESDTKPDIDEDEELESTANKEETTPSESDISTDIHSDIFTALEKHDLENMQWKAFKSKYGMKKEEFIAERKGGADEAIV